MHGAMMTGQSGDPDRDFATMMIPHHQGAIDMAEIELRYGKDERLRRLAQAIIVEQRQEIAVMQRILDSGGALPPRNEPTANGYPITGNVHETIPRIPDDGQARHQDVVVHDRARDREGAGSGKRDRATRP
ncbi:DUF305 domain-containing protein [Sphingomonas sp. UV9]|uniref:CopM family metallochaperone n=1 Tax=Sphingomonas sp. UV9 TaxID=1851410 RepID=UPI001F0BBE21|nr:DUF305 domain-containing protein [Sphingomonas sp. UV9]